MLYKFLLTSMFITACQGVCFGAPDFNDPHKLTKLVLDGTKVILDAGLLLFLRLEFLMECELDVM